MTTNEAVAGAPEANPYAASGPTPWELEEIRRLQEMDAFLAPVTVATLGPVMDTLHPSEGKERPRLLDVGGGVGATTENLCEQYHVEYHIADLNKRFLAFRDTPAAHKFVTHGEAIDVPDDSFDGTYSRATVAWSSDPEQSISELLRITKKDGGVATITDFDWSSARAGLDSGAMEEIMEVRAMFMAALVSQGFRPTFGAHSGERVDAVARIQGLHYERTEHHHQFPAGDHSAFLLKMVQPLLTALREKNPQAAADLADNMEKIRAASEAGTVSMSLPALVTQVVRLSKTVSQ
jgi:ubiquinone/menaquinone biosynthesis C-methylase UbiE